MNSNGEYVTLGQYANHPCIRVSMQTAYKRARAGRIPGAVKSNREWRIPKSVVPDVPELIEQFPAPPVGAVEWFDDRYYKVEEDGQTYFLPSVTTVLGIAFPKPFLARWRGDIGNREADAKMHEGADRGSRIHHALYVLADGGAVVLESSDPRHPRFTERDLAALRVKYDGKLIILKAQDEYLQVWRFRQWVLHVRPRFIEREATLYSLRHGIAGTMDAVVRIDAGRYDIAGSKPLPLAGGHYIMDYKTGSMIGDDHFLQMAAYRRMYEDAMNIKLAGALIVHTNAETRSGIEGLKTILRTAEELDVDWRAFQSAYDLFRRVGMSKPKVFELPTYITIQEEARDASRTQTTE